MPSIHTVEVRAERTGLVVRNPEAAPDQQKQERATVVSERKAADGGSELYVHFVSQDKRMDRWVKESEFLPLPDESRKRKRDQDDEEDDARSYGGVAKEPRTIDMTEEEYDLQHHKKIGAQRNFDKVQFGQYIIRTWYFSPYPLVDEKFQLPTDTASDGKPHRPGGRQKRVLDVLAGSMKKELPYLYVCEFCFTYTIEPSKYDTHCKGCKVTRPPGKVIYEGKRRRIWAVDGSAAKLYCQNLALFGKLFIDVKTLFFDCENFMFYVATEQGDSNQHNLRGFFSKEKVSFDDYNLACIVTLPPYQRGGWGTLMIEASYEISFRAGKAGGTPERPLSDLGLRSYLSYWVATLLRFFRQITAVRLPPTRASTPTSVVNGLLRDSAEDATSKDQGIRASRIAELLNATSQSWVSNRDGSATVHCYLQLTIKDIARATNLRLDDTAFALNEIGFLTLGLPTTVKQRLEKYAEALPTPPDPNTLVLITREMVEEMIVKRNVKDDALLDLTKWVNDNNHKHQNSILPGGLDSRRRDTNLQLVLEKLHLRVQTSAWNTRHDALSRSLRPTTRLGSILTLFYNAGVVFSALGAAISLGLLLWNCAHAVAPWVHSTLSPTDKPVLLAKRTFSSPPPNQGVVKPIIPGITTPLNHLPAILAAVFAAQIVHELGHAISAALDAVPIVSAGASFTIAIPAAFVSFPAAAMDALRPWARARIIAAGPFHNLVFWLVLLATERLARPIAPLLYRDISNVGRVVKNIDEDSDLWSHLALGSVITQVDDVSLASPEDLWSSYLTSSISPTSYRGWCASTVEFSKNSRSCCDANGLSSLSCFSSTSSSKTGCLDAISILTGDQYRCEGDEHCASGTQCVRPHETVHIVRISVQTSIGGRVVLWGGPKHEIFEQVEIGTTVPRLWPCWMQKQATVLWIYLKLATLSLCLFNLLPLPHLDGTQFMQALFDLAYPAGSAYEEYDIDALEAGVGQDRGRRGRWKSRLTKVVPIATSVVFVLSALLALVNAY
uniref:histone acetyltransferase n=1 Tax=Mycena chlorophos TaxID=658473 RepID=A0ABQ0M6I9_MYCCL|nr:ham group protein [Mycena chlorophos]